MISKHTIRPGCDAREGLPGCRLASVLLLLVPCVVHAQDAAGAKRGWTVEPSLSVRETITDNANLQPLKSSDSITAINAAVRVVGTTASLRGSLDYSLTEYLYARHSGDNGPLSVLSAEATAEVIDGLGFVDLRGNYSQQAVSAFGSQSTDPALGANNRTDVADLYVSPYLRGRLGSTVHYELRASYDATRAKGTSASDVNNGVASLHLDGRAAAASLGWTADASHSVSRFLAGRRTFDDRLRAGMTYVVNPELQFGANAGRERTDLPSVDANSDATWGAQAEWTPTERTKLAATAEKRFFGTAHSLHFTHRTPSTVWPLSDSRDISTSNTQGKGGLGSAYDLFFLQFASVQPDPVLRDALVRSYLQANGIPVNAVVIGGFLSAAATLVHTQSLSFALVGARNTVTVMFSGSNSSRADKVAAVVDDLSNNNDVRQRGITLDWSYRLTPTSSLSATGGYQRSDSDSSTLQTTLKTLIATWTGKLGPRSSVSAGARHTSFDSPATPYRENALFASFRLAF